MLERLEKKEVPDVEFWFEGNNISAFDHFICDPLFSLCLQAVMTSTRFLAYFLPLPTCTTSLE